MLYITIYGVLRISLIHLLDSSDKNWLQHDVHNWFTQFQNYFLTRNFCRTNSLARPARMLIQKRRYQVSSSGRKSRLEPRKTRNDTVMEERHLFRRIVRRKRAIDQSFWVAEALIEYGQKHRQDRRGSWSENRHPVPDTGAGAFGAARLAHVVAAIQARLLPGQGLCPGRPTDVCSACPFGYCCEPGSAWESTRTRM